jgi:hypothetical protein
MTVGPPADQDAERAGHHRDDDRLAGAVPVRPFAASWSLICPKISTGVESEEFRRPPVLFGCTTSSPGIDLNLG